MYSSHKKYSVTQKGFTLIEVLVYIAVLVIVAGALISTFLSFDTVLIRNKTERVLTQEARMSLELISQSIRDASAVDTGLSTFDASPGVLALTAGATTTRFYVSGGTLMYAVNGVDVGPLTSKAITIQNITFNRQVGSSTELVRVALTLSAHSKTASSTRTFNTSAVLRGSYE